MKNEGIRSWYMRVYPTDDLGKEINPEATFAGMLYVLKTGQDVYRYLGGGDSVIRERCFSELAERMNWDYDKVYHLWLRSA